MAQSVIGALRAELSAGIAKFADDMNQAGKTVEKFSKKFKRVGSNMRSTGRDMSMTMSAPIIAFGGFALKAAGDFEQSMNRVTALTGATGKQFEALRDQAKELGATTQFSASEAADGMGFLAMAGFDAQQILETMPDTLNLAAAAQIGLAEAADIASNVLQSQQMETSELGHVTDVLTKAFSSSNTDLLMLAEAFKYAGPITKVLGIRFEEAAAAIGLMGNAGIQASMAGTSLRGAMTKLLNPSKKAAGLMERMGINVLDAQGNMIPMREVLLQLERAFGQVSKGVLDANGQMMDQSQAIEVLRGSGEQGAALMEIFGQRAGPAMAALLGQGSQALDQFTRELENSGGTAKKIADVQMKGFNGAMRELKSAFEALQIAIADAGLLQTMTDLVKRLAEWTRNLADSNPKMLKWATIIAAAAAALGPLIWAVGATITGFGGLLKGAALLIKTGPALVGAFKAVGAAVAFMGGPITLLVTALAGLAAAWIMYGDEIRNYVSGWVEAIANNFKLMATLFRQIVTGDFKGALGTLKKMFANAGKALKGEIVKGAEGTGEAVADKAKEELEDAAPKVVEPAEALGEAINAGIGAGVSEGTALDDKLKDKIESLRDQIFPIQAAMDEYREKMDLARQAGLDLAEAHRVLRDEAFAAVGGLEAVKGKLEELPPVLREAAKAARLEGIQESMAQEAKRSARELEQLSKSLTMQFDPAATRDARLAEIEKAFEAGKISAEVYEKATKDAWDTFKRGSEEADKGMQQVSQALDRASQSLTDMLMGTKDFETGMREMLSGLTQSLFIDPFVEQLQTGIKGVLSQMMSGMSGGAGGGGGGIGGLVGGLFSMFAGAREMGGLAMAGRPYLVGERGPEVFRPHTTGTVEPNGSGAGGVTQNFYVQTPDANSFRRSERQITRSARQKLAMGRA